MIRGQQAVRHHARSRNAAGENLGRIERALADDARHPPPLRRHRHGARRHRPARRTRPAQQGVRDRPGLHDPQADPARALGAVRHRGPAEDHRLPPPGGDPSGRRLRALHPPRKPPATSSPSSSPEYVVGQWWENLLHNQSALWLKSRLLFTPGVMVTSVPWQLPPPSAPSVRTALWNPGGRSWGRHPKAPRGHVRHRTLPRHAGWHQRTRPLLHPAPRGSPWDAVHEEPRQG